MNSQVTYIKWFWNNSGILESVEVKFNPSTGDYYNFCKGKQFTYYAKDLFDSRIEAYEWKLNKIIIVSTPRGMNLFNSLVSQ